MIEIIWALALAFYAILLWIGVEAVKSLHHAAGYLCFSGAALILGSADIMYAATTDHPLGVRLLIAAIVGAVALIGLSEGIRYVYRSDKVQNQESAQHKAESGKNSPNISSGGNVTIGHIGDIINQPPEPSRSKRPLDEKLPGFASGLMVQTKDITEERKKYQFYFHTAEGSKAEFYLSASNRYAFSVTDTHGSIYTLDIPLGSNGIPFEKFVYMFCEVGTASSYSYLRALVNGIEVARQDLDFPLELGSRKWIPSLGANSSGQNSSAFMLMEAIIYTTTLSDAELVALAKNALQAYGLK